MKDQKKPPYKQDRKHKRLPEKPVKTRGKTKSKSISKTISRDGKCGEWLLGSQDKMLVWRTADISVEEIKKRHLRGPDKNGRKHLADRVKTVHHYSHIQRVWMMVAKRLHLLRDVARYICSYLTPFREKVFFVENRLIFSDVVSGRKTRESPPLLMYDGHNDETLLRRPRIAYDQNEIWVFGENYDTDTTKWKFDLETNEWSSVNNADLDRYVGRFLHFYDDLLVCLGCSEDQFFASNRWGRLSLIPEKDAPVRTQIRSQVSKEMRTVLFGDMLFVLECRSCFYFPTKVEEDADYRWCSCWNCRGSDFKRISAEAGKCCCSLQVLYLSDLTYGWTNIKPPPCHYSSENGASLELFVDERKKELQIIGGYEQLEKNTASGGKLQPVEGKWVLKLSGTANQWRFTKGNFSTKSRLWKEANKHQEEINWDEKGPGTPYKSDEILIRFEIKIIFKKNYKRINKL